MEEVTWSWGLRKELVVEGEGCSRSREQLVQRLGVAGAE